MSQKRNILRVVKPEPVIEGAGVRLIRSIAGRALDYVDPFLLFDHFGSSDPDDYRAGFPMHPHRGIETVTYMLSGRVRHKDSLGNSGTIGPGDVQWMTAGRGILHEEMPQVGPEPLNGFQLWVNLPARLKMTSPRYQDVPGSKIPELVRDSGVRIRLITGELEGVRGPVTDIAADPIYMDVLVPAGTIFELPVAADHNSFAYAFEGAGLFAGKPVSSPSLVVWDEGDQIEVRAEDQPVRFLLVAGKPLNEPVARYGPFVMNTREEIEETLQDLRRGTFV